MANYQKSEIVSGAFVALAITLFTMLSFRIGAFDPLKSLSRGIDCIANLPSAQGLQTGDPVMVAGIRVGDVSSLTITEAPLGKDADLLSRRLGQNAPADLSPAMIRQLVAVNFTIRDRSLRLEPETARVSVSKSGVFGDTFLALDPGYWTKQSTPIGQTTLPQPIALTAAPPAGLDAALANVGPIAQRLATLMDTINTRILTGNNIDVVQETLADLNASVAAVRELLKDENPQGVQQHLLDPLNTLLTDADESIVALRERILDQTLSQAETFFADARELTTTANKALNTANQILDENRPNTKQIIDDLAQATENLDERINTLDAEANRTIALVQGTITENRPEIAESLRRLRRTMWEAELAMKKIRANPAYLLFGGSETIYDQTPTDESSLRRTGRAEPYKQRDESDASK